MMRCLCDMWHFCNEDLYSFRQEAFCCTVYSLSHIVKGRHAIMHIYV